ncbi:MAG: ATP-dependent Clp protease proteolytic subunit [Bacteroidia bacterium]|nr:ATP-dependent Clp protease proteolytic subunit [Bacteroidia bacterium]
MKRWIFLGATIGAVLAIMGVIYRTQTPMPKREEKNQLYVKAENIIVLAGPINDTSVGLVLAQINQLRLGGHKYALLVIDSPGGNVISGNMLINVMRSTPMTIDTYCAAMCFSMAAFIFEEGKTRYMAPSSILMFHPARVGLNGNMEDVQELLTTFKNMLEDLFTKVLQKVPQNKQEKFLASRYREIYLLPKEAKELNLMDKETVLFADE